MNQDLLASSAGRGAPVIQSTPLVLSVAGRSDPVTPAAAMRARARATKTRYSAAVITLSGAARGLEDGRRVGGSRNLRSCTG